jgi:tetratricopeptide (TPR) repeat protein
VLRFDPENIKFIHLKNRIEKKVKKINIQALKKDIDSLKGLWKEKKYQEILENLKHLEPYIKDYPALKPLILKAQTKYLGQLKGDQEMIFKNETTVISNLLNEKKFQDALRNAEKLRVMGIHENDLKTLIQNIKNSWIDSEIKENQTLLNSKKYEDILFFYQKLQKIDPKSKKIVTAIDQVKKTYKVYKIEEKKEFIYKSLENIRTLYQLKKYEKALIACNEILEIDPENKEAISFQKMSEKMNTKTIDDEVVKQMIHNQKNLKLEYQNNKKTFTKL